VFYLHGVVYPFLDYFNF